MTAVAATTLLFVGPMADKAAQDPSPFDDGPVALAEAPQLEAEPRMEEPIVELLAEKQPISKALESGNLAQRQPAMREAMAPRAARLDSTSARPTSESAGVRHPPAPPPVAAPEPAAIAESATIAGTASRNSVSGDAVASWTAAPAAAMGSTDDAAGGAVTMADADEMLEAEDEGFQEAAPETEANEADVQGAYKARTEIDFEGVELSSEQVQQGGRRSAPARRSRRSAMESAEQPQEQAASTDSLPTRGDTRALRAEHKATTLMKAGDFAGALKAVEAGIKAPTGNPMLKARLLRLKADILLRLGRETEAQQAREQAARLDPLR